jgi:hypothetical protein
VEEKSAEERLIMDNISDMASNDQKDTDYVRNSWTIKFKGNEDKRVNMERDNVTIYTKATCLWDKKYLTLSMEV